MPHDPSPESSAYYTIEMVEQITHLPRERIVLYYRSGLVSSITPPESGEPGFDEEAVHRLSRIAFYLSEYGVNDQGIRMLSELMDEVERLRQEVRFFRR